MKYYITHFPEENERSIKKEKGEKIWRLSQNNGKRMRTLKKDRAKRFFHESSVESALSIIKFKKGIEEEKPQRPEVEKQSWGELSS